MTANKTWLEVTGNNITNINTTRTDSGGPYHRQTVSFQSINKFNQMFQQQMGDGVKVNNIGKDSSEKLIYDPSNPDANKDGYVRMPNIDAVSEMTNMMAAQRGYEESASVLDVTKKLMQTEQTIGKV